MAEDNIYANLDGTEPLKEKNINECQWYHGMIDRATAEWLVVENGEFLVRESTSLTSYVVTCKWNGKHLHVLVKIDAIDGKSKYRFETLKFTSVSELITFYQLNQLPVTVASGAILFKPVLVNHLSSVSRNDSADCVSALQTNSTCTNDNTNINAFTSQNSLIHKWDSEPLLSPNQPLLTQPQFHTLGSTVALKNTISCQSICNATSMQFQAKKSSATNRPLRAANVPHLSNRCRPQVVIRNAELYLDDGKDYTDYAQISVIPSYVRALQQEKIQQEKRRQLRQLLDNQNGIIQPIAESLAPTFMDSMSRKAECEKNDNCYIDMNNALQPPSPEDYLSLGKTAVSYLPASAVDSFSVNCDAVSGASQLHDKAVCKTNSVPIDQTELQMSIYDSPIVRSVYDNVHIVSSSSSSNSLRSVANAVKMVQFVDVDTERPLCSTRSVQLEHHSFQCLPDIVKPLELDALRHAVELAMAAGPLRLAWHLVRFDVQWLLFRQITTGTGTGTNPTRCHVAADCIVELMLLIRDDESLPRSHLSEVIRDAKADIADRHDALTFFVVASLVTCDNIARRKSLLCFWLIVAVILRKKWCDFFALDSIMDALFGSHVQSLTSTVRSFLQEDRKSVAPMYKKLQQHWSQLKLAGDCNQGHIDSCLLPRLCVDCVSFPVCNWQGGAAARRRAQIVLKEQMADDSLAELCQTESLMKLLWGVRGVFLPRQDRVDKMAAILQKFALKVELAQSN